MCCHRAISFLVYHTKGKKDRETIYLDSVKMLWEFFLHEKGDLGIKAT